MFRVIALTVVAATIAPWQPALAAGTISVSQVHAVANRREVVLSGSVTNTGLTPVSQTLTALSAGAITSRIELDNVLAGQAPANPNVLSTYTYRVTQLAAGRSQPWSITIPLRALTVPTTSTVLPIGVQFNNHRTFVTAAVFQPDTHRTPTQVTIGVQIATDAPHLPTPSAHDEAKDVTELNRIARLVRPGPWTLFIDPDVYLWLQDFQGTAHESQAQSITASLKAASSSNTVFGGARLDRLVASKRQDSLGILMAAQGVVAKPIMVVDRIAPRAIESLREFVTVAVTNEEALGNGLNTTGMNAHVGDVDVLVRDSALEKCLALADESSASCTSATIAMMTSESPNASRHVLAVTPRDWNPSDEVLEQLQRDLASDYGFAAVIESATDTPAVQWTSPAAKAVSRSFATTFDSLVRTARDAATVFPESQFANRLSATALAATSDAYTAAQGLQLLQTASQSGKDELAKVTIEASTRFTIPGQQAQIPITVANTSEQRTTVSVTIVPESSGRVRSTAIDPVTIEPGQRITVPLDVVVTGVGTVRARVQLATKDGSTFGVGERISITTTAYQSFARSIVWLALAALLILAGRGIRTRRRSS